MIVRLTFISFQPGKAEEAKTIYNNKIIPVVKKQKGNIECRLMEPTAGTDDYISMTSWDSKKNADAYHSSGPYQELVGMLRNLYSKDPVLKVYTAQDILEHA